MSGPLASEVYEIANGWIVQRVDACTCYGGKPYGHEPGCGWEPLVKVEDALRAVEFESEIRQLRDEIESAKNLCARRCLT